MITYTTTTTVELFPFSRRIIRTRRNDGIEERTKSRSFQTLEIWNRTHLNILGDQFNPTDSYYVTLQSTLSRSRPLFCLANRIRSASRPYTVPVDIVIFAYYYGIFRV
jgi:hypothetical protein